MCSKFLRLSLEISHQVRGPWLIMCLGYRKLVLGTKSHQQTDLLFSSRREQDSWPKELGWRTRLSSSRQGNLVRKIVKAFRMVRGDTSELPRPLILGETIRTLWEGFWRLFLKVFPNRLVCSSPTCLISRSARADVEKSFQGLLHQSRPIRASYKGR